MQRFFNWLADKIAPETASAKIDPQQVSPPAARRPQTSERATAAPRPEADVVTFDAHVDGRIDNAGPGKNVLRPSKYGRDDAAAYDTLSILDDNAEPQAEPPQDGMDPYNTGRFDRSRNWDKHFRKN